MKNSKLIFDVGMHKGMDTEFYLNKGFNVVAVEANPSLVSSVTSNLEAQIDSGRLKIYNVAIAEQQGEIDFFINKEKDDWSSIFEKIGGRGGSDFEKISVSATTLDRIIEETGIPYYLKIDIEHADHIALKALHKFDEKPTYVSCECHSLQVFFEMHQLGYTKFKIVNQRNLWKVKCPNPSLEGNYYDQKFSGIHSGPFGEEAPGEWVTLEEAVYMWLHKRMGFLDRSSLGEGWYDLHASR